MSNQSTGEVKEEIEYLNVINLFVKVVQEDYDVKEHVNNVKNHVKKYDCCYKENNDNKNGSIIGKCNQYIYSDIGDGFPESYVFSFDLNNIVDSGKRVSIIKLYGNCPVDSHYSDFYKRLETYGMFCNECFQYTCGKHYSDNIVKCNDYYCCNKCKNRTKSYY